MSKPYYTEYPDAPAALISGISAACQIPTIVGAHVGTDQSIFLEIFQNDDFRFHAGHLDDLAEFCLAELEDVFVEPGPDADTLTVTINNSCFDFSEQFKGTRWERHTLNLPGDEDSDESFQAFEANTKSR